MEKELKKLKEKCIDLFNDINVIDIGPYDYMEIDYTASFYDEPIGKNWDGFYYNGNVFKDMIDGVKCGGEICFNSIKEIIDLIPRAKKYNKKTAHIYIRRWVRFRRAVTFFNIFNKENDLRLEIGSISIPIDDLWVGIYINMYKQGVENE